MLQTTCHLCVSGCGRYLGPGDGHDRCLTCLGSKHAEVAFVDEASSHGGKMIILELRPGSVTSTKGRSSVASASIWFLFWLQTDEDYFRWWHGWSEDYSGGKPSREPTLEGPSLLLHSKPVELPVERAGPSTRGVPAVSLVLLPMTGCRSLHRRVSWSFLGKKIRLRCC